MCRYSRPMLTPISDDVEQTRLSIARALWVYAEDTLLARVETLGARQVSLIGVICAAELARSQQRHLTAMPGRLRGWPKK